MEDITGVCLTLFRGPESPMPSPMRLTERLQQSFDPADQDQARDYLATMRDAWRDITTAFTRNAWIIVLLIAAFELANHRTVSTITLGPFALNNVKYVRLFIPAVVSYLLYEQVLLLARWIETETVHRFLVHHLSPRIEEHDFDALLTPRLPALSNLIHSYSPNSATRSKNVRALAQYALALLVLASIPTFDAFALVELGGEFGVTSIIYWATVAVTAALILLSLLVLGLWLSEERLVW
jgi:hypothetical protein